MTFVSYAQNFEDVLLWRALKGVGAGFYVDVGASFPDVDSVTRAFYDRGWRGINVEPTRAAFARLQAARPRDINLRLAAGQQSGTATFYSVAGSHSGLSTTDAGAARRYAAEEMPAQAVEVQVETLAGICRAHAPADIHFLKIDVEGAERDVLAGADFSAFRPWIVVVEATAPMSTEEVHAGWEPILLGAEYRFVWFDGLNRFYVAAERHAELAPSFRVPPNIFDDFRRAIDTEWEERHQVETSVSAVLLDRALAAERRAGVAEDRAEAAMLRLMQSIAGAARADDQAAQLRHAVRQLQDGAAERQQALRQQLASAEQRAAEAQDWLAAIRHSTSWRVTAPLRRLAGGRMPDPAPAQSPASSPAASAVAQEPDPAPAGPAPQVPALPPAGLTAVHQFHSGSAVGDAITNAMLLTRDLLRSLGYASRIFVEHKDPGCGDALETLDALPEHDRYALLVRHSLGHDALARILALPAPKLLIYHNITPPEFLADSTVLQDYSRLGRAQLAELRPAVRAALADSEYNAIELRREGFAPVAACPLLFDVDAMLAHGPARQPGPAFTMLFVGRVTRSKGQLELVEAYARFRELYAGDSRLVLVGRHGDGRDPYLMELLARIRRHGLDRGAVELAGLVSEAEKLRRYGEADLYVSLSRHEGFGVPLVEAMAYGVPILAWPTAAVPYTLDGASRLLADTTPDEVARAMLALATDAEGRAAIAQDQRRSLERFRLARQVPALLAALEHAGVARLPDPEARAALLGNMRFTVAGHVNGSYSLAEVNRAFATTLEEERPGTVRLLPVEGEVTARVDDIPAPQRAAMRRLLARGPAETGPEVVISQHYPVWVPVQRGDVCLALFFWEESRVPPATVATLNARFDGVLAPSRVVAKALVDSGVHVPVRTVGFAPRLERFRALAARRHTAPRDPAAPYTFLHVSSCFPRKGVDVLLAAYAAAFRRGDPVRLVIKGFPNPHNDVPEQLERWRADPEAPAVELINHDLDADALLALYEAADAMVLPTRGEGYNIPAAEALAAGLRLIVTGHGGHMDFIGRAPAGAVRTLAYRMAPARTHLATPGSLWAEPDADDLAAALREAAGAGPITTGTFAPAPVGLAAAVGEFAAGLLLAPQPPPPDVAWVTTWGVRCGIAEYAAHLVGAMPAGGLVLADMRSAELPAGPAGPEVAPVWQLGDPASLPALTARILRRDPDAVVIQHQPGLMHWTMLAALLADKALQGRAVCVALHSARRLLDAEGAERRTILAALAAVARIVVHTVADVNVLAGLGLEANVSLIAHGAPELRPAQPPTLRRLAPADEVRIGCYGFFLPDKGIGELVAALPLLRRHWPRARLRLVNAEYPGPESRAEIAAAREAAAQGGVAEAVEFETGFLDHAASLARLAACDLVVLPYQTSKEGSSAALRTALSAGVPVLVTPLKLFDEAEDAVIRLSGTTPDAIAAGIAASLADQALRQDTVTAAARWLDGRAWGRVAAQWDGMLRALARDNTVGRGDAAAALR